MKSLVLGVAVLALSCGGGGDDPTSSTNCAQIGGTYDMGAEFGFLDGSTRLGCDAFVSRIGTLSQTGCSFTASVAPMSFRGTINGSRVDLRFTDSSCSGEARGSATLIQTGTETRIEGIVEGGLDGLICCADPNARGRTRFAWVTLLRRGP